MRKTILATVLLGTLINLAGCDSVTKQDVGMVSGGAIGGLMGSRFGGGSGQLWTTAIGTLGGAMIGGMIGKNMDQQDQLKAQQAIETSRTGQSTTWQNPDNGNRYTVTPRKKYVKPNHQPCREYTMTATVGGKEQQVYGTACRQADGSWKMKS